jgi:NTE family protein
MIPEFLGQGVFVGAGAEAGNALPSGHEWQLDDLLVSGTVLAGLDTMPGPLYLGWGYAEGGRNTFYLTLGHVRRLGGYIR